MLRGFGATLVVLAAWCAAPATALACTCLGGMPPCQALWLGGEEFRPTVFEGTVVSLERVTHPALTGNGGPYPYVKVILSDVKSWIGDGTTTVTTGLDSAMCGYTFEPGKRYVIHATRNPATGDLRTGLCSQTRPIERAQELLEYLRALSTPSAGASIFGRAVRGGGPDSTQLPVEGARVRLAGRAIRSTATDADGRFEFRDLPPGTYEVEVNWPSRPDLVARLWPDGKPLWLGSAHACARLDAWWEGAPFQWVWR